MEEPLATGFTTQGTGGGAGEAVHVFLGVGGPLPPGGLDPQGGHQALGEVLVHGQGGAHIPRAGVGDAHEVKGGLDPAVLPAGAVEGQEDHIGGLAQLQHAGAELVGAVPRPGGPDCFQVGGLGVHLLPPVGDGEVEVVHHRPLPPGQAEVEVHQGGLVAQAAQGMGDHGAGREGHVPLRAEAPGQDDNLHGLLLSRKPAGRRPRRGHVAILVHLMDYSIFPGKSQPKPGEKGGASRPLGVVENATFLGARLPGGGVSVGGAGDLAVVGTLYR